MTLPSPSPSAPSAPSSSLPSSSTALPPTSFPLPALPTPTPPPSAPIPLPHLSATPAKSRPHTSSRSHPHADAVLPRGSRVRITGNNRTKWDLIGRTGLVRAAQTLGGWHEVQLTDGAIVRVQRNALEVLELAAPDPAALVRIESAKGDANRRPAAHSVRPLSALGGVAKRKVKKNSPLRAALKADRVASGLAGALHPAGSAFVNIAKLNVSSLRRYRSVYNLNVAKDCSKDELVGAVKNHFEKTKVNESEVISSFLRHIARRGGPAASD